MIPSLYYPYLGKIIEEDPGYVDATWVIAEDTSYYLASNFDRFNLRYTAGNFQVTVGRQRINWGINCGWNPNDIFSSTYKLMVQEFAELCAGQNPLINVGGHEHNLQVLDGREFHVRYILVSGAGSQSKLTPVGHGENTLFAHEHAGFMVVDFLTNGDVWLQVVEPGSPEIVFKKQLASRTDESGRDIN